MRRHDAWLLIVWMLAPPAAAFDVGDPWFHGPHETATNRIEFVYEALNRNVDIRFDRPMLGTPATGPVLIGAQPADVSGEDEGDVFLVRWVYQPVSMVATQLDVGFTSDSAGEETSLILGGAVRFLLLENGPLQLSTQFDGHYIPSIKDQGGGVSATNGPFVSHGEYRVHELGVALLGSMTHYLAEDARLMFYGGPRLSTYRGRYESHADYSDTGERVWFNANAEESGALGVVLGVRFDMGPALSARVEGRVIEEQSLSASLMASF